MFSVVVLHSRFVRWTEHCHCHLQLSLTASLSVQPTMHMVAFFAFLFFVCSSLGQPVITNPANITLQVIYRDFNIGHPDFQCCNKGGVETSS